MKPQKNQRNTQEKKKKKMFFGKNYAKYINPFTDFGFKRLFGEECNKDLLLDFLNELLYAEQGHIVNISYLKLERLGISANSRHAVFDIYCENEKGEKFIVELQKQNQRFFKDRSVFYSTFPIIEQAQQGEDWGFELKAVYVIAILNFVFEEDKNEPNKYRYDVKLSDIKTHKIFYNKLTFIYLEMPKFTKEIDEIETRFEKWLYVIKNLGRLDNLPDKLRETVFEKMFAAAEVAQLSQGEYMGYIENVIQHWDTYSIMKTAKEDATAEGMAKGMAKGLAEGMEKGRAEERENMVINSHQAGLPLEMIAKITDLSVNKVSKIIEKFKNV